MYPPEFAIQRAVKAAVRSVCRSQRGAAIWEGSKFISAGFNRQLPPLTCDHSDACKATCRLTALHAEMDALLRGRYVEGADMLHVKVLDQCLVPSGGPSCVQCSKLILASGIRYMWLFQSGGWHRYTAADFHHMSVRASG